MICINYLRRLAKFALLILVSSVLVGCIGLIPSPFRPSPGPQKTPVFDDLAEAFDIVCRNYKIGPKDDLSILYSAEWNIPIGTYKLDTLDKLKIKFILDPQLNEDVIVRPDGMITLQAIGDIRAVGLTPEQLSLAIQDKFVKTGIFSKDETKGDLKNYQMVTVSVDQFYEKITKLMQSLMNIATGSKSNITVKPDGTIDLPLLRDRVLCAGHSISEVENTVNRLYREGPLKHVVVSMSLGAARSRKVYVLGQVRSPGGYEIDLPITALQALALAGGEITDLADLTSVILISKDVYGKPIGRRLDLKKILDVGDMSSAILVKPYDVLYVPRTYIGDVNLFMGQYLRAASDIAIFHATIAGSGN
jgi:polysaccharide biosynthesis/export protein